MQNIRNLESQQKCLLLIKLVDDLNGSLDADVEQNNSTFDNQVDIVFEEIEDKEKMLIKIRRLLTEELIELIKQHEIVFVLTIMDRIAEAYYTKNKLFDYHSFKVKLFRKINDQIYSYLKELNRI